MVTDLERAAEAIKGRYGSVHAFCQRHPDLNRTTVYQVLKGTYGGNLDRQLGRILAALDQAADSRPDLPGLAELEDVIRAVACQACPVVGPADLCKRCAPLHRLQAQAVRQLLESRGGEHERQPA